MKGVSETMEGRMSDLEKGVQNQWMVFRKEVDGKDRGTRRQRSYRHQGGAPDQVAVQREADERWRNRMDREDRQDYYEHYRHCAPMW